MGNDTNNWFELLLTSPKLKIVRHLLLQLLILLLSLSALGSEDEVFLITDESLWSCLAFYVIINILCYLNIYLLVPRLLLTGRISKYKWFILILMTVFILCSVLSQLLRDNSVYQDLSFIGIIIESTTSYLVIGLILFATSTMALFVQWMGERKRIGELKLATKQSELNMLKQQINPHFLFNMLNNVNVLLKRAPEEASQILFKLEKLLNYQLNDSTKETVDIGADIRFLNDFLNLEKIRRDRFDYSITEEGDMSGLRLPPLLFIPFVENAVKHNPDNNEESFVHIKFEIKDRELYFRCENSKPAVPLVKSEVGGLGLKNINRRLELLYPERHTLSITDEDKRFTVLLTIKQIHK